MGADVDAVSNTGFEGLALADHQALVAVVDGGPLYHPMARMLEEWEVPVFRTADRALRVLGRWVAV